MSEGQENPDGLTTAFELCPRCNGQGMQDNGGWIGECSACGGDCMIRARDSKGRFTTLPLPDHTATPNGGVA